MIDSAVILAAGRGSRLKERTANIPKGLLSIGNLKLIERSVRLLKEAGMKKIVVGTGYLAEKYNDFFSNDKTISCVKNHDFKKYGSMHTLYSLRDHINSDFLLLESDLLYETKALTSLLQDHFQNAILASGFTKSGDECFIESNDEKRLINISKNPALLKRVDAEFVGISKLTKLALTKMCHFWLEKMNTEENTEYETALVEAGKHMDIYVNKVDSLVWCEIDDETHLNRAKNNILPLIKNKELND